MKTILITGAGSGIGEALAMRYASERNNLLLIGRNIEKLSAVASRCRESGAKIVEVASIDVADRQSMESWISAMDEQYSIDIVIANAGIAANTKDSTQALSETVNTNIFGVLNTINPCVAPMQKRGKGNIVIISSIAGILPAPDMLGRAMAAYCMSKRFLRIYGEGIRCLYSSTGVKVHVICPSLIRTGFADDIIKDLKMCKAKDPKVVVDAVRWAISFNSPIVTAPLYSFLLYRIIVPMIPFPLYASLMTQIVIKKTFPDTVCDCPFLNKANPNPKCVLITGASSGLGAAIAKEYAANDMKLMLFGTNEERLEETAKVCTNKKAAVSVFSVDVTDAKRMKRYITECDEKNPLDLVIANAGISGGVSKSTIENPEQIYDIVNVNITGVLNTIEPAIARMKKRKQGQIILISSFLGLRGVPGQPTYCAAKGAVLSYGESLRMELSAYNIGVTIVCCGYIRTPMSAGNPLTFTAARPETCARAIKRDAANNKAISIYPFYMSGITQLANALLPIRVYDWFITKFYPRRLPMKKYMTD